MVDLKLEGEDHFVSISLKLVVVLILNADDESAFVEANVLSLVYIHLLKHARFVTLEIFAIGVEKKIAFTPLAIVKNLEARSVYRSVVLAVGYSLKANVRGVYGLLFYLKCRARHIVKLYLLVVGIFDGYHCYNGVFSRLADANVVSAYVYLTARAVFVGDILRLNVVTVGNGEEYAVLVAVVYNELRLKVKYRKIVFSLVYLEGANDGLDLVVVLAVQNQNICLNGIHSCVFKRHYSVSVLIGNGISVRIGNGVGYGYVLSDDRGLVYREDDLFAVVYLTARADELTCLAMENEIKLRKVVVRRGYFKNSLHRGYRLVVGIEI